jgi:Integrase core domain
VRRYEREKPGELIHLDVKKLGKFNEIGDRITGDRRGQSTAGAWVGNMSTSASTITPALPSPRSCPARRSAVRSPFQGCAELLREPRLKVERVMTDNGSCYKSFAFRRACKRLELRHIRTKPYTPKTNGKAERFIQTSLREWPYAYAYYNSRQRRDRLPYWLHRYNWHRLIGHPSADSL